jgi:hypothetical protein
LTWYEHDTGDRTGWEALATSDVVLAVVAADALVLLVVTATQRVPAVPIAYTALLVLLGTVATVLVLVRVAWLPGTAEERESGLWLGLAGALGIASGGWIAMRDERRATSPPSEIEPVPAPKP